MIDANVQQNTQQGLDVAGLLSDLTFGSKCSACRDQWKNDPQGSFAGAVNAVGGLMEAAASLAGQEKDQGGFGLAAKMHERLVRGADFV
jgi:hypothetical protein